MNNQELEAIIDAYLSGTLPAEKKQWLEHTMTKDPTVAKAVEDSRMTMYAIQLAYDQQLRQKMRHWDAMAGHTSSVKKRKRLSRLIVQSLLALLILATLGFWYFSPTQMARRGFHQTLDLYQPAADSPEALLWVQAQQLFDKRQYKEAGALMAELDTVIQLRPGNILQWNQLLCDLARQGPTEEWLRQLSGFDPGDQQTLIASHQRIQKWMKHSFYIWVYRNLKIKATLYLGKGVL